MPQHLRSSRAWWVRWRRGRRGRVDIERNGRVPAMGSFQAIVAREPGPAELCELSDADLPEGDVTVAVSHSSLNYKDGLAVTGAGKLARSEERRVGKECRYRWS